MKKKTSKIKPPASSSNRVAKSKVDDGSVLSVVKKAPSFKVQDEAGNVVSLATLKGKRFILYFYPKDSTPGCTQESCDFRDSFSRFKKMGVAVYGVSRDSAVSHQKFKQKHDLPFPLLVDEDGKMTEAYGVWQEKSLYGKKFMGIVRTTVVVGADGKIERVYPKVSVKGHVDQVLEDIK